MAKSYKVNIGIDYLGKRAEVGDVVDDIPQVSLKWMLEQGIVSAVEASEDEPKKRSAKTPEQDGE